MYVVQLVVNDGQFDSLPDTATITVNASNLNQISIDDLTVTEGNSGARGVTFTVRRANPSGSSTVAFQTANGTATVADNDYASNSGTVTFGAGVTTQPVGVSVVGDTRVEPDEIIFVNLSNPSANASIVDAQATGTITNDDAAPLPTITLTATDATAAEAGQDPGAMRLTRSGGNNTLALTVFLSAVGSTAANITDYAAVNGGGSAVIPAGAAFVDLTFTPVDDALVEGNETIVRTISANADYVVGTPNSATVTIADNDTVTLSAVILVATDKVRAKPRRIRAVSPLRAPVPRRVR